MVKTSNYPTKHALLFRFSPFEVNNLTEILKSTKHWKKAKNEKIKTPTYPSQSDRSTCEVKLGLKNSLVILGINI